jgi:hypothetical protein
MLLRFATERLESCFVRLNQRRIAVVNMKLCRAISYGAAKVIGVQERGHGIASGIRYDKIPATAVTSLGVYGCW